MFALTFTLVAIALAIIYFYVKYLYSYWQRRGIPYVKPSFPFGNFRQTFLLKLPFTEDIAELYRSTKEPFIGIFMLLRPFLLIRDPELIRNILITDFQYFTDREFYLNETEEPLTNQIFAMQGQRWRDKRVKLSPAFTPNKMKMVFPKLIECGNQLQKHLSGLANTHQAVEFGEISSCYTSNVMASLFGVDADCFANPNHPFRNAGLQLFEVSAKNLFRFLGWFFLPKLLKWSGLRFVDRSIEEYFLNLVTQTLEERERKSTARKDFLQVLLELGNDSSAAQDNKSLSVEQVAAEVFGLFMAGFESISFTITFCLYEIAKHSDVQQRVHAEIDSVFGQHNGQITYESINELKYLDCCVDETLRKYQVTHVSRVCVKDYKIPDTSVTIEKGTPLIIPTSGLHYDETFYPDPQKFDPMRFSSKNMAGKSVVDMPNLSFGDGSRVCIGRKMAKMFVKVGICSILQKYHVDLDDRHIGKQLKQALNLHPIGGVYLKLTAKH